MRYPLAAAGGCLTALLAYSNSFRTGFPADNAALLQDPRLRQATGRNLDLILQHTYWWPSGESGLYRPLTTLSYLFNYAILGNQGRPAGYHWINFWLHAANILLVYVLARRLFREFWPAVFIAALWGVHPVLTESVTPIAGRADLLAAMALLGGFLIYLKSAEAKGWRQLPWLVGLMAVTTAGVFSKESAVAVLGVVVAYELTWWKGRKQLRGLLLGCLAMAPPLLLLWRQRSIVLAASPPAQFPFVYNPIAGADFWTGRLTAIKVMARHLGLMAWPAKLSCDYYYNQIPLARGSLQDRIAWTVVAAVGVVAVLLFRRNRAWFFLAAFAFITFLPVSNLVIPIGTIMAERFLYLPSIAFAAVLVAVLFAAGRRLRVRALAPVALCLIGAAFAVRTWARNLDWQDNITLWTAAVRTCPQSFKGHSSLASALFDADPSHSNLDRVIAEMEKSLAIVDSLPDSLNRAEVYTPAGGCYRLRGDSLKPGSPESLGAYQRSLQILLRGVAIDQEFNRWVVRQERARGTPASAIAPAGDAELYRQLSFTYARLNQNQQALGAALHARLLSPTNAGTYRQMAAALFAEGRQSDAAVALMEALLTTGDQTVLPALEALYRGGLDKQGCAFERGAQGPALNPSCPAVQGHICAAAADMIRVNLETRRPELAERLENAAIVEYGCPASALHAAPAADPFQ